MAYQLMLSEEQENRARRVHKKATVVDCSMVIRFDESFFERAEAGGVTAVNHTVTKPGQGFTDGIASVNEHRSINECRRWIEANADHALLVTSAAHIREAKAKGKVAIILGPQNAKIIEDNLGYLSILYDLGVRIMQLTYQRRNLLGDGCGERTDGGLSLFGLEVVKRMNEIGMVIDLSHCGWKTTADAIEISDDPVIFSHSNPYAVTPHVRNKSDELIRALAEKGGVIGITGYTPIASLEPGKRPSILDLVAHIDYVANLVGIDHVGIGSDINERSTAESFAHMRKQYPELAQYTDGEGFFSYDEVRVAGLASITCIPEITRALVAQGYSTDDILKVLGGNFVRVFGRVWGRS